jgi:hypothetical protein
MATTRANLALSAAEVGPIHRVLGRLAQRAEQALRALDRAERG